MMQAGDGGSLETVGYLLKRVTVALRASLDAVLAPVGLSMPQYVCMQVLAERPGISGAELARTALVTRQSMHELLRGLERRGLVVREPPVHGRSQAARLTGEGRRAVAEADGLVRAVDSRMLAPLDEGAERALRDALAVCLDGLEGAAEPSSAPPQADPA